MLYQNNKIIISNINYYIDMIVKYVRINLQIHDKKN